MQGENPKVFSTYAIKNPRLTIFHSFLFRRK